MATAQLKSQPDQTTLTSVAGYKRYPLIELGSRGGHSLELFVNELTQWATTVASIWGFEDSQGTIDPAKLKPMICAVILHLYLEQADALEAEIVSVEKAPKSLRQLYQSLDTLLPEDAPAASLRRLAGNNFMLTEARKRVLNNHPDYVEIRRFVAVAGAQKAWGMVDRFFDFFTFDPFPGPVTAEMVGKITAVRPMTKWEAIEGQHLNHLPAHAPVVLETSTQAVIWPRTHTSYDLTGGQLVCFAHEGQVLSADHVPALLLGAKWSRCERQKVYLLSDAEEMVLDLWDGDAIPMQGAVGIQFANGRMVIL